VWDSCQAYWAGPSIVYLVLSYLCLRLDSGAVTQRKRQSSINVPHPNSAVVLSIPGPPNVPLLRICENTVKLPLGLYNYASHHEDAWGKGSIRQPFLILALYVYEAG
jgi:hypothetical protein